ncbi:MAG: hypothetical protein Q9170_006889 [Blastenia crenularia]
MEVHTPVMDHPKKRRRRRRIERSPISATLIPDADLRGEEGLLSADLDNHLFPCPAAAEQLSSEPKLRYIAVSPWVPQSAGIHQDLHWTILPVKVQQSNDKSNDVPEIRTFRYPASSSVLQSIASRTASGTSSRASITANRGLRILLLDVEPIRLTTVYVNVNGSALARHEQIQKEFGGGFGSFRNGNLSDKGKGKGKGIVRDGINGVSDSSIQQQQEKVLTEAVRSALHSLSVVRQGDQLPLPLPAHPITHATLPPAIVVLCEPVNQGLLSAETKIVVNRKFATEKRGFGRINDRPWSPYQVGTENGDETPNEQFFSAVEGETNSDPLRDEIEDDASDSSTPDQQSSADSEGSPDDFISLSTPGLPNQPPSAISSVAATPKYHGPALNGTSTPGSMFSGFTATTAHQNAGIGKLFQACNLLAPIPSDLLHPKPHDDEDDESRVYVDVKDLLRLKCFSGDWVCLRAISRPRNGQLKSLGMGTLHRDDDDDEPFRAVKVYGLPDLAPRISVRYPVKERALSNRRSSVNTSPKLIRPASQAWLSPILFANLDCPTEVRLASLTGSGRMKQPFSPKHGSKEAERLKYPSIAAEVSLAKISTPISQESALQDVLFSRLKRYFEDRRRIIHNGDLIAMTIDADVGRMLGSSNNTGADGKDREEVLSLLTKPGQSDARSLEVIWFKIGQITGPSSEREMGGDSEDIWGGAACVDPTSTRMTIGTSHQSKIPPTSQTPWKAYLGVMPRSPVEDLASPYRMYMSVSPDLYTSGLQRRLRELIAAATSPRAVHLKLQPTLILLHSNQRNIGKARMATQAASDLGIHTFSIDAYEVISEGNAADVQESSINTRIARALSCGAQYTTILIRHLEALTSNRLTSALQELAKKVRILIATTTQLDHVSENLRSLFTHEIEMSAPDEGEREGILQNIITEEGIRIARDVDLSAIAVKTAALVAGNLVDIVERAVIARQMRLENFLQSLSPESQTLVRDLIVSGGEWARCITKADYDLAVDAARKNFADAIGAPKIPNVSWDDVGGLEHVKDAVMETIQLPLERPELFAKGMKKRSGILFYGPPGTGKTLLAKAIATEFSLNFFSVKGPELLNMYIGESEANVRRVFQRARDARPCVVFFDELDSVAPKRGNQGDSGGVMDRIVSQLLAELDGMSDGDDGAGGGGVFVIGATNRPDLLDQALLRPGRFDKMLYLGISDTHEKQLTILEALTRKFTLHPELDLSRVAKALPFTYTGADLYALCSDAMLKAITRQAEAVDRKIKALPKGPVSHAFFFDHLATEADIAAVVTEEDFYAAKRELVGSVSAKELHHYQRVRQSFETPPSTSVPNPVPNPISNPPTIPTPMPTRPHPTKRVNTAIRSPPSTTSTSKPKPPSSHQSTTAKGKGKSKVPLSLSSDPDNDSDDDDEAYMTSNDSVYNSPERVGNGKAKDVGWGIDKGKGKEKATMIPRPVYGFEDGGVREEGDVQTTLGVKLEER